MPRTRLWFFVSLLWPGLARAAGAPDLAVAPSEVRCPDADQVATALAAHVAGRVNVGGVAPAAGYVVRVAAHGPTGIRVQLVAPDERVALERELMRAADRRADSCGALADTIALVVSRYLRQIELDVPEATMPDVGPVRSAAATAASASSDEARWAVGAGAMGRAAIADVSASDRLSPGVELFAELRRGGLAAGVSVAVAAPSWRLLDDEGAANARFELVTIPLRAELAAAPWAGTWGAALVLARAGVDLLSFAATGLPDARSGMRVDPAVELGVGWRRAALGWDVEVHLTGGALLAPRDFDVGTAAPISAEPRGFVRAALRLGWSGT